MPHPAFAAALRAVGRCAIFAPLVGFGVGLGVPALAAGAQAMLPLIAAISVGLSVLLAEPGRPTHREGCIALTLIGANLLIAPALFAAAVAMFGLPRDLVWLVLVAGAPAATTAPLLAAVFGLPVRPAVLTQLGSAVLVPFALPLVAMLATGDQGLDGSALLHRTALVILPAAAIAGVLRWRLEPALVARRAQLRGGAVLALTAMTLAAGYGVTMGLAGVADEAIGGLVVATVLVSIGGAAVGAAAGALWGRREAGVGACVAGSRNISSLAAAVGDQLPAAGALTLQLAFSWTLLGPALFQLGRSAPAFWRALCGAFGRAPREASLPIGFERLQIRRPRSI